MVLHYAGARRSVKQLAMDCLPNTPCTQRLPLVQATSASSIVRVAG